MDPLGRTSRAVPERVSTSRGHSSPSAGLPEQARRETERRNRGSLRRRRSQGTVGRVRPCARPVGRLAVGVRGPPCPNLVGWTALAGSLSASSGSGEITLATALRDDCVPPKQASNHQSCPTVTL